MANRRKTQAAAPPRTVAEAQAYLKEIGDIDRTIKGVTDACEVAVTKAQQHKEDIVAPLADHADSLFRGLQAFVEANAPDLFPGKANSVTWPTGTVGLRMTPPAVTIRNGTAKSVLGELEKSHPLYVKITKAIDRQALIKARKSLPDVDGLTVTQRREFFAKPTDSEVERNRALPKPKITKT